MIKNKIAIIRVRGKNKIRKPVKDTFIFLRLLNKNHCVILDKSDNIMGMVKKVKDYVTYGEIDDATLKLLVEKRGKESKDKESKKSIEFDGKKYRPFFALNPPRKGYGRKGVKVSFKAGGALGYRADKINDIIKKMI